MEDVEGEPPLSYVDSWGVAWGRASDGQYYVNKSPLSLDSTTSDLEAHSWPEPPDTQFLENIRARASELRTTTDYAIVLALPGRVLSIGERLLGFEDWYMCLLINPDLANDLLHRAVGVEIQMIEGLLGYVGELVDVVFCPDDLGAQDRTLISPHLYRELIKPHHSRVVETIKQLTKARVVLHSDGAIFPIIEDIIDVGFDAINPVQVSAAGMETSRLKETFGKRISFWGGIDTQYVLPCGSPQDVRDEVRSRISDLAKGGGYVIGPVHNIQPEVPPENIVAMYEAAIEYGIQ